MPEGSCAWVTGPPDVGLRGRDSIGGRACLLSARCWLPHPAVPVACYGLLVLLKPEARGGAIGPPWPPNRRPGAVRCVHASSADNCPDR